MTIDPFWTSVAALWGAVLSTVLAVLSIVPPRPRFHFEPGDQPISDLTVRIVNPAKRMRFVRELGRIRFPGSEKASLSVWTGKTRSLLGFVRATAGRLRWAQHVQTQAAIRPRGRSTRPTRHSVFVCRPGG